METKIVMILRRSENDLTPEEKAAFEQSFPGCKIEYVSSNPVDCYEHEKNCKEIKPDAVLLPKDKPIPVLAMEQGFAHVTLTPGGLLQLKKITPDFAPFGAK